jgi:pilus assembly protein CpaE
MASAKITAGLLIPILESREQVHKLAEATGSISVEVESDQYCTTPGDSSTRKFINARPEIILVDMGNVRAGIASIETLHAALPETRLYAISEKTDPKLIIEAVRAGAREFFLKPIQPRSLSEAIARYSAEKQRMLETRREGSVYCFTAGKEGSGATTIAINVASALAAVPETRVAFIDLDSPAGDAAMYLNLTPQHKIEDALAAGSRLDSLLLESCMSQADGFSVLPPPRKEFGTQRAANPEVLAKLLKIASQAYTHTMIDLPRTLPMEHMQVVAKATEVLVVVMNPELSSISRTGHLLRRLSECKVADKIRLVVNRSRDSDAIAPRLIEKALHHPIYFRIPEDYKSSTKAMMSGKPLVKGNNSPLASSYNELARQLTGIPRHRGRHRLLGGRTGAGGLKRVFTGTFSFLAKPFRPRRAPAGHHQRAGIADPLLRVNLRD